MTTALNNRELSVAIWLCMALVWVIYRPETRRALFNVVRAFFSRPLIPAWLLMAAYIYGEVLLLSTMGVWDPSQLTTTLIWAITVAIVLFIQLASNEDISFRKAVAQNFNATIFLDFLVNLHVFNIFVELVFIPLTAFLGGLWAVAQSRKEYAAVERIISTLVMLLGLGLITYALYGIYSDFAFFARVETAKAFAVPPALSLLFIPFLYFARLYVRYQRLFVRLHFYANKDSALQRQLKWGLVRRCHLDLRKLENWSKRLPGGGFDTKDDVLEFLNSKPPPDVSAPTGFRALNWGDAPPPNLRPTSEVTTDGLVLYRPDSGSPAAPLFGGAVVEELYGFSNNKLYMASAWLDGRDNLDRVRRELTFAYGPPSFAREEQPLWKWKWPEQHIEIHLYYQKTFKRATVTFLNDAI